MTLCLNVRCLMPQNADDAKFCVSCGAKLRLGDRYRALRLIGQGGFGRTFLAIDEQMPSQPACVIKQLFPQTQNTEANKKAAELFEQEAQRLDQITHDQIPRLLAHLTQDKCQYLIQTYIEGETLAQELARNGAFKPDRIRQLLVDLLPVLQYLHDRQIIHRDIKPDNVVRRSSDGRLVLVDFGASKLTTATNLAQTGTAIGSAGYAAPEQTGGKAIFASDLYGLGVTCVHLLTDLPPFELFSFAEGRWVWRDYLPDSIDSSLATVLDRLIEPAIAQRYRSAMAALQDLDVAPAVSPVAHSGWQCVQTIAAHSNSISTVAISPGDRWLVSGSFDKTIKVWHLGIGALRSTLTGHTQPVSSLAFSPDGVMLVSGSVDDTIRVWCLHTEAPLYCLHDEADSLLSLNVAVSPDGVAIASGSDARSIKIRYLQSGKLLRSLHVTRTITSIAISPNGKYLASGSSDNAIKLWNFYTGAPLGLLQGHRRDVNSVAFSADSRLLASGSNDNTVKVWDLHSRKVRTFSGHLDSVKAIAFSPNQQFLASASSDATVRIWNVATGELLQTLVGHSKAVNAIAFAHHGRTLVSGSSDRSLKIWRQD
ncbi:MAG: protein kinase [Leptolyngbyaceae cyanobacterium SM1_3_5]|nr:protein kinase [Leptolyngbyaceae cyanobacterium SM1_3_5]